MYLKDFFFLMNGFSSNDILLVHVFGECVGVLVDGGYHGPKE